MTAATVTIRRAHRLDHLSVPFAGAGSVREVRGATKLVEGASPSSSTDVARSGAPEEAQAADRRPSSAPARDARALWIPSGVLIVGLLVTLGLTLFTHALYTRNEKRLLELRVHEVGLVLTQALPTVQTPLASAAALADATNGDGQKFMRFGSPYVGSGPTHPFVSLSLWRLPSAGRGPIAVVGAAPSLQASPRQVEAFLARAARTPKLTIIGLRRRALRGLGYAVTSPQPMSRYAAYAESAIPTSRRSRLQGNAAFSDLDYALYFGSSVRPGNLLVTSLSHPPIRGRQARLRVPFGDRVLTLVVAPRQPLAGSLPQRLPWIIGIVGVVLSLGAAALTLGLNHRRRAAEGLAGRLSHALEENQRLYAEQRTIAETLQHALLPERLPEVLGAETSARYEPGEPGVDVGGDWYDVIPLGDDRLMVVVGDVSGRGLRAASTMASLRYAIHAYAAQNDPPATILTKLSRILSVTDSGQLATVLCSLADVSSRQVTVTSAGHLPPLLISRDRVEYVESEIGLPIGVDGDAAYTSTTVAVPSAATFLAFTDGLVERRGENLDQGLARLRAAASTNHTELPELLNRIVSEMRPTPSQDDTAIVGVRWKD